MDGNGILLNLFCLLLHIFSNISQTYSKENNPVKYYLTKDCQYVASNELLGSAGNRKKLKIPIDSVVIQSHDDNKENYPENFHCELIASAQPGMQIVLQIEYLNIPSTTESCDSYLYVFDSNTSSYMAMPDAGGERGLCQSDYPKMPIFSSKSYITFVFKTGAKLEGKDKGFKLTLTAINNVDKSNHCSDGEFYCPNKYFRSSSPASYRSSSSNPANVRLKAYCISNNFLCDQISNCPDSSDEDKNYAKCNQTKGILNQFLSLGIFASIGIVVGCVVLVTIFITLIVRCCRSTSPKMTAGAALTPGSAVPMQLNGSSRVLTSSQPLLVGGIPDAQLAHERASSSGGGVGPGKSPHLSGMRQEYLVTKIPPSQHFPQSNGAAHASPNLFRKGNSPHFSRASNGSHEYPSLIHPGPFHPQSSVLMYDASSNNRSYPGSSVDAMQPFNPNTPVPSQDAYYIPAVNGGGQQVFTGYPQMMTSTEVAHRSHTPTSSRSGKSGRSRGSRASGAAYHYYNQPSNYPASVSSGGGSHQPAIQGRQVKYHHRPSTSGGSSCDTERITYPVQL